MMMPRSFISASMPVAVLLTFLVFVLNAVLAQALRTSTTQIGIAASLAATCESILLIVLLAFVACQYRIAGVRFITIRKAKCCVAAVVAVMLASIASGATLVCLSQIASNDEEHVAPFNLKDYLIAGTCILCIAFILQLSSIALFFTNKLATGSETPKSFGTSSDGFRSPEMLMRVKAVPYEKTTPARTGTWPENNESRPVSRSGTINSIRSSLSQVVRPISSKTRLLSVRSSKSWRSNHSGTSTDLESGRGYPAKYSFDNWDASSIEAPQPVLAVDTTLAASGSRFLETIPASPMTSRCSSPGIVSEPEPVSTRQPRRSRSYSPQSRTQSSVSLALADEAHIHPLFRSDSPAPPTATPSTMIVAAPNAGQTITEKSLSRMRSSSLSGVPPPLSRQGSFESFSRRGISLAEDSVTQEIDEANVMAPPIPAWVLSAASRTSLHEYQTRRIKEEIAKDGTSRQ